MMKKTDSNILSHLWTAEKANERALFEMWHDWSVPSIWDIENDEEDSDDEEGHYIECVVPDVETAKAYYKARHIRECYYGGMPSLLDRSYTSEEAEEYSKWKKDFVKCTSICAIKSSRATMGRKDFAMCAARCSSSRSSTTFPSFTPALKGPA